MSAPTGYTTVSASNLKDATGAKITNATILFQPVDNNGRPISFRSGGSAGQTIVSPVSAAVMDGAFSVVLADTTLTTPTNIGYAVTVIDNVTGESRLGRGYECIQPSTSTWSFDNYVPNLAAQVSVIVGGQGPAGPPLTPKGVYNGATSYSMGDVVVKDGSSYISLINESAGNDPASSSTAWMLLAAKGSLDTAGVANMGQYVSSSMPKQRNLLDASRCTSDFGIHPQDGTLIALTGATATDFIPCAGVSNIYLTVASNSGWNSDYGHAFYDANRTYLSGGTAAVAGSLSVPTGAAYFRQSLASASLNTAQVVRGSSAPTSYSKFGYDSPDQVDAKISTAIAALPSSTSVTQVRQMIGETQPPIPNLFDVNRAVPGAIHPQDGTVVPFANLVASDFIRIYSGETYTTNVNCDYLNPDYGYAYYDANKAYVSGGRQAAGTFTVPAGVSFYRQYIRTTDLSFAMIVRGSTLPATPIGFGADDPMTVATKTAAAIAAAQTSAKKFGVIGDSISAVFAPYWQTKLAALAKITHGFNDARAGRGTTDMLENFGSSTTGTYSGTPVGGIDPANWQMGMSSGQTLAQALAPIDVLFIFSGTNDGGFYTGSNVGTPGDAAARTGSTFCAAVAWLIETIQTAKPLLRIVWITPYQYDPGNGHGGAGSVAGNLALVDAIVGTCALKGVPVVDMFRTSGINSKNWAAALRDGLHPSDNGFDAFVIPAINRVLNGYR